jgi:hypothetical protein
MGKRDARIDAYIAKSAEFARPVLEHLRAVVHAACPTVEETVKWLPPRRTLSLSEGRSLNWKYERRKRPAA